MTNATPYAALTRTLADAIDVHSGTVEPAVVDYMLMRAALLDMAHRHGWAKAAEVAVP